MAVCLAVALDCEPFPLAAGGAVPVRIEVFTTSERPVIGADAGRIGSAGASFDIQIYELDGIALAETRLSEGLPADAGRARPEAARRIHSMRPEEMAGIRRAAFGLAKLVQHGLDRLPAIVLDNEAVVLGVTDVGEAMRRYRQWRTGSAP